MPSKRKHPATPRDLVLAVIAGDIEAVKRMHAEGVSIKSPDQYGWLPIHRAAANNREEIIRLLVSWGSPLEERGTDQWTALHLAAVSRSPDAVRALLECGADIHTRSVKGHTPLHLAIGPTIDEVLYETVETLVAAGARVDLADRNGASPLEEATKIGDEKLIKIVQGGLTGQ